MKAVVDAEDPHDAKHAILHTPTQASTIALTQGPDRSISPTKEKRTPSNFMKALKEAINELHDGMHSLQAEHQKNRTIVLFTSRFDGFDSGQHDEMKKLIFYLHALQINLVIFYYEFAVNKEPNNKSSRSVVVLENPLRHQHDCRHEYMSAEEIRLSDFVEAIRSFDEEAYRERMKREMKRRQS